MATLVGAGAAEAGGVAGVWAWDSDTIPQASAETTKLVFKLLKLLSVRIPLRPWCSFTQNGFYCFLVTGGGVAGLDGAGGAAGPVDGCA